MTRKVPGQGRNNMYAQGTTIGGPDAIQRLRKFYDSTKDPACVESLRLAYMAAEAGVDAPLTALQKFADLVRADLRQCDRGIAAVSL